jgi:hypothetical protein
MCSNSVRKLIVLPKSAAAKLKEQRTLAKLAALEAPKLAMQAAAARTVINGFAALAGDDEEDDEEEDEVEAAGETEPASADQ